MTTMNPLQKFFITTAIVLVLIGLTYYFYVGPRALGPSEGAMATTSVPSATSTANNGNANIQVITPDYFKPIVFSSTVSAAMRAQLNGRLKLVQAELDTNKLDIRAWVDLGTIHKMGGDYAAAAEYWEYVVSTYSGTGAPYYGLGDLYENFLHNTAKAEVNYKMAIEINPKNVDAYASLYTMYHYTLHDDAKAADIIEKGLKANPGNNYLLGLKAELDVK